MASTNGGQGRSPSGKGPAAVKNGVKGSGFQPGAPIKFFQPDDEVKRMHAELDKRDRLAATAKPGRRKGSKSKAGSSFSLTSFAVRVLALYFLYAYLFVCPADKVRERAVCRGLDSFGASVRRLEPHWEPYRLQAEKKLEPFVAAAKPYVDKARPYVVKADAFARPQIARAKSLYSAHVHPQVAKGFALSQTATKPYMDSLKSQYSAVVHPSVDWYSKSATKWYATNVTPHLDRADKLVKPLYADFYPAVKKHHYGTVVPFVNKAYKQGETRYRKQVRPVALRLGQRIKAFLRSNVLPSVQRFYSLYIAPQVDKIGDKFFEYQTKHSTKETLKEVEEAKEELFRDKEEDDFDEFISELRREGEQKQSAADAGTTAPVASPSLSPQERKAQVAAKRKTLVDLHTKYEKQIAKLGQKEHDLLVERLVGLREKMQDDIPKRFEAVLDKLVNEYKKMMTRMIVYFQRAKDNDKLTEEEKVYDAEFLSKKAIAKVDRMRREAIAEVDEYLAEHQAKEVQSVGHAKAALKKVVEKAQEDVGFGYTWLDDVTYKDWQRYHQLAKAEKAWAVNYDGVQASSREGKLNSLDPVHDLDDVRKHIEKQYADFVKSFEAVKVRGQKEIKGEWTGIADAAAAAAAAAGSVYDQAASAVSSVAGITPEAPTPTDLIGSASSVASEAQESALSVFSAASASASSAASVASAAGSSVVAEVESTLNAAYEAIPPIPTDFIVEAIEGAVGAVQKALPTAIPSLGIGAGVAEFAADASSVVSSYGQPHEAFTTSQYEHAATEGLKNAAEVAKIYGAASQSVIKAVGGEPSPTDLAQSASSLAHAAADALPTADLQAAFKAGASEASSALDSATTVAPRLIDKLSAQLHDVTRRTPEGVAEHASSLYSEAASAAASVQSVVHDQVRTTPEGVVEHVASAYAEATSKVAEAAASVQSVVHEQTRTTPEGVKEHVAAATDAVKSKLHVEL